MLDLILAEIRAQRRHVEQALTGLPDADLMSTHPPTTWTPAGLVHHLAVDVERWWFTAIIAGEASARRYFDANPDGAWTVPPETNPLALYQTQQARSDQVLQSARFDDSPAWWPSFLGPEQTVGEIALHVAIETATHAGQLDVVRESIDGTQWLVFDPP